LKIITHNFQLKLLALLCAGVLWTFVVFSREYEVQFMAPLTVKFKSEDAAEYMSLKDSVSVRIKARGFALLRSENPKARVIIEMPAHRKGVVTVLPKQMRLILSDALKRRATVLSYEPLDYYRVDLSNLKSGKSL
jgi:hypothetical protein